MRQKETKRKSQGVAVKYKWWMWKRVVGCKLNVKEGKGEEEEVVVVREDGQAEAL